MKGVDGRREGLMGGACGRVGFIYIWMIGGGLRERRRGGRFVL